LPLLPPPPAAPPVATCPPLPGLLPLAGLVPPVPELPPDCGVPPWPVAAPCPESEQAHKDTEETNTTDASERDSRVMTVHSGPSRIERLAERSGGGAGEVRKSPATWARPPSPARGLAKSRFDRRDRAWGGLGPDPGSRIPHAVASDAIPTAKSACAPRGRCCRSARPETPAPLTCQRPRMPATDSLPDIPASSQRSVTVLFSRSAGDFGPSPARRSRSCAPSRP
jgi:hypothetical protein